ncbi:MAG: cohesin domain-containing protein, partial [Candidatus Hydrogenedentes bacterium]|nr:cohesin domain-containing protein [Candidatus Hydrogenedentota bacterium]
SGTTLGAGSCSLAILYVTVKEGAETGQTSPLTFASAELNGGLAQVSTQDGLFTVNNDSYLWGDVNGDGHVNNADSVLILKYRAGIVKKTSKSEDSEGDFEFFAAGDVSGDDPVLVGTVDASLIMRYNEGSISSFPCDLDGDGVGPELTDGKTAIKEAVLRDYGPPGAATRLISIPGKVKLEPEATYEVPVSIDTADMIRGYYIEVSYDSRALEYLHTSKGTLTQEWLDPIVNPLMGKITVVGANAESMSGQGTVAVLTFRALPTVTRNAATRLKLEAAELNDALILSEKSTGMGEPVISALEPNTGAETGGTVVRITGVNLGDVFRVLFGGMESPWVRSDATGGALLAVTPPGGGTVDVTVESPAGVFTLAEGFTFFVPQVHLTMTPEETVVSAQPLDVPVWVLDLSGGQVSNIAFDLHFDPKVLTPKKVNGAFATLEDSALEANKALTATLTSSGCLHITLTGSGTGNIESGLLATCHLVAIASEEERAGLIYISETVAQDGESKALRASASLISK